MLRGTLMRGGIFILAAALLWVPLSSATAQIQEAPESTQEVSSRAFGDVGWIESLLTLFRNLVGADESGGTFEPNGQNGSGGSTSCGEPDEEPCPETTTTTTSEDPTSSGFTVVDES